VLILGVFFGSIKQAAATAPFVFFFFFFAWLLLC
jgi:hypothetical protein